MIHIYNLKNVSPKNQTDSIYLGQDKFYPFLGSLKQVLFFSRNFIFLL